MSVLPPGQHGSQSVEPYKRCSFKMSSASWELVFLLVCFLLCEFNRCCFSYVTFSNGSYYGELVVFSQCGWGWGGYVFKDREEVFFLRSCGVKKIAK